MGGIGVFWLLSTAAQTFTKYEVWYTINGFLGIVLPCEDMQYRGLVEQVFPGLQSVDQLVRRFRVAIEIWAGKNPYRPCVDMYHRTIVAGSAIMPRWARWRLTDIGTEPTHWLWARRAEFAGVYDLSAPAANPMVARL
jgi:hypothetical protein